MEKLFLRIIKIGTLFILFTPLVMGEFGLSFSEWPKTVFFRVLIEIIFVFYLVLVWKNSKYLPKMSLLVLAVSIFIFALGLSTLTSINPARSFWGNLERSGGLFTFLHFYIFFIILAGVFSEKKTWIWLLRIAVFVSAISGLAGILQKFGVYSFYGNSLPDRISGTLSNPDFFGNYLVLSIFLGLFLISVEKKIIWKLCFGAATLLGCYNLFFTRTRGAWLGFLIGLSFFVFFWLFKYAKQKPKLKKAVLCSLIILAMAVFTVILNQDRLSFTGNVFFQRFLSISNYSALQPRLVGWGIAGKAWQENLVLGRGLETLSFFSDKYFRTDYFQFLPEGTVFDRAHNALLDLLANAGLLGLLSYFFILFAVFYYLFKKNEKFSQISGLLLATLFVAYFVQNLFSFDTIATYLIFFLLLAFVNNNYAVQESIVKRRFFSFASNKRVKRALITILIFLSLASIYEVNLKTAIACRAFIRGLDSEKGDFSGSLSKFKEAISSKTIYDKEINMALLQHLIDVSEKGERSGFNEKINDLLYLSKFSLEKDLEKPDMKYLFSHELVVRTDDRLYATYQNKNTLEAMTRVAEKALSFNNASPIFWRLLGKVKILQRQYEEGEAMFRKSLEVGPKNMESQMFLYQNLGAAYYEAGEKEKAAENFEKTIYFLLASRKFSGSGGLLAGNISFIDDTALIYLFDLKNPEKARLIYEKTMDYFPQYKEEIELRLKRLNLQKL